MEYKDYLKIFGERNSESNIARTPAYIFDVGILRDRVNFIRSQLRDRARIIYAIKANPFLTPYLTDLVDAYEICSPGEERICERYGIPASMMVLSGVNKQQEDFERAYAYALGETATVNDCPAEVPEALYIGGDNALKEESRPSPTYRNMPTYTVESLSQLEMLARTVKGEILLRVTSGNQFGLDPEDAVKIIREREKYPNLEIVGLQYFSGTQKTRKRVIQREIQSMDALMTRIEKECGFRIREFEFGPGLPVSYFVDGEPVDDADVLDHLMECIEDMEWKGAVSFEIGRFIAASCGSYITRIVDIKHSRGVHYAIVDGGIHQMNYYGQMMAMKYPFMQMRNGTTEELCGKDAASAGSTQAQGESESETEAGSKPEPETAPVGNSGPGTGSEAVPDPCSIAQVTEKYEICGSLCTVSDVIIRQLPLADPQAGDILVFERTGAYSVTEGISLFLSRDLPHVYIKDGEKIQEIRKQFLTEELNYGRTY